MDIKKLVDRINSLSLDRKLTFLKLLRDSGRLSSPFDEDTYQDMVVHLDSVYAGKWDIFFDKSTMERRELDEGYYHDPDDEDYEEEYSKPWTVLEGAFLIHFEDFDIVNGRGLKHNITDMFIKLPFRSDNNEGKFTISAFHGRRMSATKEEIVSHYHHSHLSGRTFKVGSSGWDFNGFCTGSGDIDLTKSRLRSEYNSGQFKLFLMQLNTFLQWESLGGVPYKYIKDVLSRVDIDKIEFWRITQFYDDLKRAYHIEEREVPQLNFKLQGNYITLKDDKNFDKFLKFKGEDHNSYYSNNICSRDEKGSYLSFKEITDNMLSQSLASEEDRKQYSFVFKDKLIEFQLKEPKVKKENIEFLIHPKIKQYVKQQIEQTIQKERFGGYITKELNSTDNSRISSKTN